MNETAEARYALDRIDANLERFRWLVTHPHAARIALNKALFKAHPAAPDAAAIVKEIDIARATQTNSEGSTDSTLYPGDRRRGASTTWS